jgi:hypothetical protein
MGARSASCRSRALRFAGALLVAGCASAPPPLPPARGTTAATPADPAACATVLADLAGVDARMREAEARIAADRGRDQAAGYAAAVGAVFFPPTLLVLAADTNAQTRRAVEQLYAERDAVLARAAAGGCALPETRSPVTPPPASAPG